MNVLAAIAAVALSAAPSAPNVNENSGALSYVYGFDLPPARGTYQPGLSLTYSSASKVNAGYGVGWAPTVSYVEHDLRAPPSSATVQDRLQYWVQRDGDRKLLVQPDPVGQPTTYRPEVASDYFTLSKVTSSTATTTLVGAVCTTNNCCWEGTDGRGNKYVYECVTTSCDRWYLTWVVDPDSNVTSFSYLAEATPVTSGKSASALLQHIRYNAYPTTAPTVAQQESAANPSVGKSGNWGTWIELSYVPEDPAQGKGSRETVAGTIVDHTQLLKKVTVKTQGYQGTAAEFRRYDLSYQASTVNTLALLKAIQEFPIQAAGWDPTPRPATTFEYADALTYSLTAGAAISLPDVSAVGSPGNPAVGMPWTAVPSYASWQDLDGDGRPDLVWSVSTSNIAWARNTTPAGAVVPQFASAVVVAGSSGFGKVSFWDPTNAGTQSCAKAKMFDFDGDGLPDLVQVSGTTLTVRFGQVVRDASGNFQSFKFSGNPANGDAAYQIDVTKVESLFRTGHTWLSSYPGLCIDGGGTAGYARLQDLNGDGIADYYDSTGKVFLAFRGTPSGASGGWAFANAIPVTGTAKGNVDLSGDGLPDVHAEFGSGTQWLQELNLAAPSSTASCQITARGGVGLGWSTSWSAPNAYCYARMPAAYLENSCGYTVADHSRYVGLYQDMNGDGLPDYVVRPPTCSGSYYRGKPPCPLGGSMYIAWNGSRGLGSQTFFALPTRSGATVDICPAESYALWVPACDTLSDIRRGNNGLFVDANGDGIPDYVYADLTGQTWTYYGGSNQTGAPATPLLKRVVTPLGAQYDITYAAAASSGSGPGVVVKSVALTGTALETFTTTWWYGNLQRGTQTSDGRFESWGFDKTWSQDSVTGVVRETTWGTTHLSKGLSIAWKTFLPKPSAGWSPGASATPNVIESGNASYQGRSVLVGKGGACVTDPAVTDLPVILFALTTTTAKTLYEVQTQLDASLSAIVVASQRTSVPCSAIDDYGNVQKAVTYAWSRAPSGADPNWPDPTALPNSTDDPRILITESLRPTLNSTCKTCPQVTKNSSSTGSLLYQETQELDTKGHVLKTCKGATTSAGVCGGAATAITTIAWHGDGTLWTSTIAGVTKQFAYDAQQLRVAQEATFDGVKRIATDHMYDPAFGLRSSSSGPYLVWKVSGSTKTACNALLNGRACDRPTRHFDYDGFGRPRIVAQARTDGLATLHGTYTGWVEAYEYFDGTSPVSSKSYRFGDGKPTQNYSFTGTPGLLANDIISSTTYLDALGRAIQQRESLGGGQAASGGHVVQAIAGRYRVVNAVVYDGAGRVKASVEPFHSTTGAFQDLSRATADLGGARATVPSYDLLGRAWCQAILPIPASGAIPPALTTCTSDTSDTASFRLATETRFAARLLSGKLGNPLLDGTYLSVKTVAPDQNVGAPGTAGSEQLMDGAGRGVGSLDAEGNAVWVLRDAMGREVAAYREGPSGTPKTPAAHITYNAAGLVISAFDPSWGNPGQEGSTKGYRDSFYDTAGRLAFLLVNKATGQGICYAYEDLGRITRIEEAPNQTQCGITNSVTVVAQYYYDQPFDAADAGYSYPAGRLTWTSTPETTIVYGYDDAGRPVRRDQWFAKIEAASPGKRFTMTTAYGGDGRALTADFLSPGNATFTHAVDYDSAGRPVKISSGTTVFWEAKVPSGGFASYDALGRVPSMQADTGKVASQRVYGAYNGALLSELKFFTTTGDIFKTAGATYQGTKLAGYDDNVTRTRYANTYWTSGRVKRLDASPISGYTPATMTQDYTHDFTFNGVTNLASAIEEKNARTSGQTKEKRTKTPAYNSTNDQMSSLTTDLAVNGALTSSSTDTFTYDALGRMATRGGTAEVFTYDLQGHLTQVKRAGVVAETLAYGPTGELLYRQVGSQYSFYVGEYATVRASTVGNSTTPGAAVNASTIEVDAHVLWAGARIASKVVTGTSGRTLYYYRTRLGSVIATSLAGGTMGAQYRYTPYGEVDKVTNETTFTKSDLGYTGALRLTGSLVYLKNRVYHVELKVFLQPDSVDRLRYAYVSGDPINASDPTGLAPPSDPDPKKPTPDSSQPKQPPPQDPKCEMVAPLVQLCGAQLEKFKSLPPSVKASLVSLLERNPIASTRVGETLDRLPSLAMAAPEGPDGRLLPPPVPPPPGKNGEPNEWVPIEGSKDRPVKWKPRFSAPGEDGGQPSASWDDKHGHWDIDDGDGKRTRFLPNGAPVAEHMEVLAGAATIGTVGLGYLAYRIARMVPSVVVPALWPTIPANAVVP